MIERKSLTLIQSVFLFARKTKSGVPDDFKDHASVVWALGSQLQCWLLCIPAIALVNDSMSANAIYAWKVVIILMLSLTNVVVVVAPKIFHAMGVAQSKRRKNQRRFPHCINNPECSEHDDETGSTESNTGRKSDEDKESSHHSQTKLNLM